MSLYGKIIDLQKLNNAWSQVYRNKPKEGVDYVTCEEFEKEKMRYIKELWNELVDHTYVCQPVQLIPLYKGEKVRYISLYTMRDKVIQCSIARELTNIYDGHFSDSCYAYRSGKSAVQAAQKIENKILDMGQGYALRADIHAFFDGILHEKLRRELQKRIHEEDVFELLFQILKAPSLDRNGKLTEKSCGIYQGATVAPILSNIYMMKIDAKIEQEVSFYVRYSDDMVLVFENYERAMAYKNKLQLYLGELGLSLNEKKTKIVSFEEGFEFLGYSFTNNGMEIPDKAKNQLAEKLEEIWLDPHMNAINKKLEKCVEIVSGWEQYFSGEKQINNILEFTVCVYQMKKKSAFDKAKMEKIREKFENPYKDVMIYLAAVWKTNDMQERELWEYEQYYSLTGKDKEIIFDLRNPIQRELLEVFERYAADESEDTRSELIQLYSDLRMYQKAECLMENSRGKRSWKGQIKLNQEEQEDFALTDTEISRYMEIFVAREDLYAQDVLVSGNKRHSEEMLQPLLPDIVMRHIQGKETVSTYIQRSNGTVKYMILDLDISKGILLQKPEKNVLQAYMDKCLQIAAGILTELQHMGVKGTLEYSGNRGYHIWIFFEEWKKGADNEAALGNPSEIRKIIAANQIEDIEVRESKFAEVDSNLEEFGVLNESVKTVLEGCNLLRYLCRKAMDAHYLNHFERLTILYVFGHLGDEGKEFIHTVMSYTLNYSYQTTQKFIQKCPEKPISCIKLREQYKQISAEIGCSCSFKRTKNCYPSPVLHALKKSEENSEITMPVSKTLPVEKQKVIKDEINVITKTEAIAEKIMELRKQKRSLDKALNKCEQELSEIFDDNHTDSMEIKMGFLVRRKNGDRIEWLIEL